MIIDCRERCVNNVQSIPRWYWVICYREDTATGPIRAVCSWLTMNCGQSRAIPRAAAAAAGAAGPRAPPFGRRRPARATAASRTRTVRDRPPLLIRTLCRYHFPVWRLPTISSSSFPPVFLSPSPIFSAYARCRFRRLLLIPFSLVSPPQLQRPSYCTQPCSFRGGGFRLLFP